MSGSLVIAGLGPGDDALVTPEVTAAMARATDIVGYIPYVARVRKRPGLTKHASDNRVELDRAQDALRMAAEGRHVVVVSSGDPGVFAMASAVFEAVEGGPDAWRNLDIRVLPGITAMRSRIAFIHKKSASLSPPGGPMPCPCVSRRAKESIFLWINRALSVVSRFCTAVCMAAIPLSSDPCSGPAKSGGEIRWNAFLNSAKEAKPSPIRSAIACQAPRQ